MATFLKQTGITTDDKPVISGCFRLSETEGLPLEIIFDYFAKNDVMPNWIDTYKECLTAGMKHKRILSMLGEAIYESFGKEFRDVVISRLDLLFKDLGKK